MGQLGSLKQECPRDLAQEPAVSENSIQASSHTFALVDQRTEPVTFASKADANAYVSTVQTGMLRDEWIDPDLGRITLAEWWMDWRPGVVHSRLPPWFAMMGTRNATFSLASAGVT